MTTSFYPYATTAGGSALPRLRTDPAYQSFWLLRIGFTVMPIVVGLDKFFHVLTNWDQYLAPRIDNLIPGTAHEAMYLVGGTEIAAGLLVALWPRFGGYVVAAWLAGIIANLLLIPGFYDIALRDFGLLLGALTLARLASAFPASSAGEEWDSLHVARSSKRRFWPSRGKGTYAAIFAGPLLVAALAAAACDSDSDKSTTTDDSPAATQPTAVAAAHDRQTSTASAEKIAALHDDMRKLWEDHITWTRLYIVSAAASLPDTDATAERLLQNQTDIGNAIKPIYGDAAGNQLTALLRDHILTAADLIAAAKSSDQAATQAASDRWYANGSEIAGFLSSANPQYWPRADMEKMMKDHLDLTLEEAVARLKGDYQADIAAYEKVHTEILAMADMLSSGIAAQHPEKFQ